MSAESPDTTVVHFHRLESPASIGDIEGTAWRVDEANNSAAPLSIGEELKIGDTIAVGKASTVKLGELLLEGGSRGRAHAFISKSAFASSPSKTDVPRLIEELAQIEERLVARLGSDPLALQDAPASAFERSVASDFAFSNITIEAARDLTEDASRRFGAVCLFFNGDAACVAVSQLTVGKMRALMEALGRPINPHMVDEHTLATLTALVYGSPNAPT